MSPSAGQAAGPEVADPRWKVLYTVGGVAALVAVVFFRRNCGAELMGFRGFGFIDVPTTLPSSAVDWFALLQEDRLLGLILLDVVDVVNYVLLCLVFLALYGALHRANKSAMTVATTFGFVGITVYFASNQAFAMLALNDRYAAATTEAQRSTFLAAGEALLAISQGTGVYLSLFLVVLAGLIISIVMLRSGIFGKATAYVGIVANGLRLGYFIALAFAPTLITLPIVLSAPFRVVWYILIALGLFRLAARASDETGAQDGH